MKFAYKKVGIWGFGQVGQSALPYFQQYNCVVGVMDQNAQIAQKLPAGVVFYEQSQQEEFFVNFDFLFVSPGIDIEMYYAKYASKWLHELDLFCAEWNKPLIAITGSVGKTTITTFLTSLLKLYNVHTEFAGNIGIPLLTIIPQQQNIETLVVELSSFQLERTATFSPALAIWTNCIENHLDRHKTFQNYFDAKYNIIAQQKEGIALLPLALFEQIKNKGYHFSNTFLFFNGTPTASDLEKIGTMPLFYVQTTKLFLHQNNSSIFLFDLSELPSITLQENWLIIIAALYILDKPLALLKEYAQQLGALEHRIEKINVTSAVEFYNDSKSTTPTSTIAAVQKIAYRPTVLLLGGLSKGVDRSNLIVTLKQYPIIAVVCFGAEADLLFSLCNSYGINGFAYPNLDEAVKKAYQLAQPNNSILFSPAGSSYDLFKNYEERGTYFKELIHKIIVSKTELL